MFQIKYLYDQPIAIPGLVFSASYYAVALVTLFCARFIFSGSTSSEQGTSEERLDMSNEKH
jgi:cytochrome c oxidase assembly protein Cox11